MRRKIPSTTALMALDAAARHQSFTKAAHELCLTQGAICRQISGLESSLGVKLFKRTRQGVALTEAGRLYSQQIAIQLDALERDTLSLISHQGRGRILELAVIPTFATYWLIPRLNSFYADNPDIRLNLSTQTRPFMFEQTHFDAALYYGNAGWPGTEAHFLMHEVAFPVCSPRLLRDGTSLTVKDISTMPLLQQTTRPYAWRNWFSSLGVEVSGDMRGARFELFTMLAKAAENDMGLALIPPMLIESELNSGRLKIVMNHAAPSDNAYFLIIPESKSDDSVLLAFRDWMLDKAGGDCPQPFFE